MMDDIPRPTPEVAQRIEELLREQLTEAGVAVSKLKPEDIARDMHCNVSPEGCLTYLWKEEPILDVVPEIREESVMWRMFTKDDA